MHEQESEKAIVVMRADDRKILARLLCISEWMRYCILDGDGWPWIKGEESLFGEPDSINMFSAMSSFSKLEEYGYIQRHPRHPASARRLTDDGAAEAKIVRKDAWKRIPATKNEKLIKGGDSPVFSTFILEDGSEYEVTENEVSTWADIYRHLDIESELTKIKGWCLSHPQNRKTRIGVPRFLNNWFSGNETPGYDYEVSKKARDERIAATKRKVTEAPGGIESSKPKVTADEYEKSSEIVTAYCDNTDNPDYEESPGEYDEYIKALHVCEEYEAANR